MKGCDHIVTKKIMGKEKTQVLKDEQAPEEEQLYTTEETSINEPPTSDADWNKSPKGDFPVVGIGASVGGLAAFEAFFSTMPDNPEPGMAFILVHIQLDPNHKSILTDLIKRYINMSVYEVNNGMAVNPNCVYVIPPNRDMIYKGRALHLLEPAEPRDHSMPIDSFFSSLAGEKKEQAIGIVLSGTGSDGTLGVRAIKVEGGMVMAQSVISTGLADYILPSEEMPAQLISYITQAFGKTTHPASRAEDSMKKIFNLVLTQTGHDFSDYKKGTIIRRIERRMTIHNIKSIDEYVRYLEQKPAEVEALFRDFLIGVTSFFRNPKSFEALKEKVIPDLFVGKCSDETIRIWVPGCSTGEEAYSIGILLQEQMEMLKQTFKIQIFATDIDSRAIEQARIGIYPASISADISSERLERFFTPDPDGKYRIQKSIRDTIIFSKHDLIKDPPFSKLDLVSCRNVLIYVDGELQKRFISNFFYALNPDKFLFLGPSETVNEFTNIFDTLDRAAKVYQSKKNVENRQLPFIATFIPPRWNSGGLKEVRRDPRRQPKFRQLT